MHLAGLEDLHLGFVPSSGGVSLKLLECHGVLAACVTIMT